MRSKLVWGLFIGILVACDRLPKLGPGNEGQNKLASAAEEDCGFVQNSFGQRVSWKQSLPIKIFLGSEFTTDYETSLREAAKKWEEAVGRTLFVFERSNQVFTTARDYRNSISISQTWGEVDRTLQAVTSLTWYNSQLTEADIRINAQYFSFYVDKPSSTNEVHLTSLFVHELGHILGLKHLTGVSVMTEILDYLLKRELPTEQDRAHLKCEYN
ncbi:MAG: matrixin family metalloprotease [Bdellovibrionaceae bacterium]|nr:matrixin family metalloprotease [Pseudobdellovibrionaceae bacterium]